MVEISNKERRLRRKPAGDKAVHRRAGVDP